MVTHPVLNSKNGLIMIQCAFTVEKIQLGAKFTYLLHANPTHVCGGNETATTASVKKTTSHGLSSNARYAY